MQEQRTEPGSTGIETIMSDDMSRGIPMLLNVQEKFCRELLELTVVPLEQGAGIRIHHMELAKASIKKTTSSVRELL